MLNIWIYSLVSVLIISLISFVGILTFSIKMDKLKKILLYMVSFSAGALFGDAFIHLLPGVIKENGFGLEISFYLLFGIAFSFIVEKFIHWRHCHIPTSKEHVHPFAMMNLFGDGVHNFIDGVIIGASYLVSIPVGIATTIAVILHELPQEIGDFGVLLHGGFSKGRALFFNFITALAAVFGAIVSLLISSYVENITIFLIPFAAGTFIYIAGSDLIPELHKEVEAKKSLLQFVAIVLGVLVMLFLLVLE
ncbi:ZIP family metal transporter [Candidatus Woesearchaeota archaeon]|nr:ZIP family metal transporter [Candidatus Woesearchaeota archaeon]